MQLKDELKALIIKSGWTMTKVVDELNKRKGSDKGSVQNFSAMLSRGSLKYIDVVEILDIIGYSVEWVKNN